MSKRQILTHNTYCGLMTNRKPSRIYAVGGNKTIKKSDKWIKQSDDSKAMLAKQLASLF